MVEFLYKNGIGMINLWKIVVLKGLFKEKFLLFNLNFISNFMN